MVRNPPLSPALHFVVASFKSMELAMLHASQVKSGAPCSDLCCSMAEEIQRRGSDSFCAHGLSSLAWAFAYSRHPKALATLQEIAHSAAGRTAEFDKQGLATVAWACAAKQLRATRLLEAISGEVQRRRLGGFNAQVPL